MYFSIKINRKIKLMIIKKIEFSSINLIYLKENKILCIIFEMFTKNNTIIILNFIYMYPYVSMTVYGLYAITYLLFLIYYTISS